MLAFMGPYGQIGEDFNISPRPGVQSQSFVYGGPSDEIIVDSTVSDHFLVQQIKLNFYELCIDQKLDLLEGTYDYVVYDKECSYENESIYSTSRWFTINDGELYENTFDPSFNKLSYDEGYAEGFDEGFDEGFATGSEPQEAEMDQDRLEFYAEKFPFWVARQRMYQSFFQCDSDIRMERPFPDEADMFAFWANQDCSDYDLILNIMLDAEAELNLVGYVGADLSAKACVLADNIGDGVIAC